MNHLRIGRMGNYAANEEEKQSIAALPSPDAHCIFVDGDLEGIERWAKDLCSKPSVPVQMPTIPVGGFTFGNHEPRIHGMDAPDLHALRYGVTATVPEHLTGSIQVPSNELLEQVLNLKLALERIDARLKRLEVARG